MCFTDFLCCTSRHKESKKNNISNITISDDDIFINEHKNGSNNFYALVVNRNNVS